MPKPLPVCATCGAALTFVRIGRLSIPVQLRTHDHGSIAAYKGAAGAWIGRFLAAGEKPYGHEKQLAKHEHRADGTLIAPA